MIWLPKCFNISDQFICADFTNKTICCMRICQRTNCVVKLNKIVLTSVNPDIVLVHNYYFCGFLKLFFFLFFFWYLPLKFDHVAFYNCNTYFSTNINIFSESKSGTFSFIFIHRFSTHTFATVLS